MALLVVDHMSLFLLLSPPFLFFFPLGLVNNFIISKHRFFVYLSLCFVLYTFYNLTRDTVIFLIIVCGRILTLRYAGLLRKKMTIWFGFRIGDYENLAFPFWLSSWCHFIWMFEYSAHRATLANGLLYIDLIIDIKKESRSLGRYLSGF